MLYRKKSGKYAVSNRLALFHKTMTVQFKDSQSAAVLSKTFRRLMRINNKTHCR